MQSPFTGAAVIPIAIPGAGKSTLMKQWFPDPASRIELDEWRLRLTGSRADQSANRAAVEIQYMVFEERCARGLSTAVDGTNITVSHRMKLQQVARGRVGLVAVVLDIPVEICHRQNRMREQPVPDEVIDHFAGKWAKNVPPGPIPGFDLTIRITPQGREDIGHLDIEGAPWLFANTTA